MCVYVLYLSLQDILSELSDLPPAVTAVISSTHVCILYTCTFTARHPTCMYVYTHFSIIKKCLLRSYFVHGKHYTVTLVQHAIHVPNVKPAVVCRSVGITYPTHTAHIHACTCTCMYLCTLYMYCTCRTDHSSSLHIHTCTCTCTCSLLVCRGRNEV